jgi:type 1 fimbria pilin
MNKLIPFSYLLLFCLIGCQPSNVKNNSISVSFTKTANSKQLDGRLLLMLSNNDEKEPRFQINDGLNTQLIFGMNVDGMTPEETITFDDSVKSFRCTPR